MFPEGVVKVHEPSCTQALCTQINGTSHRPVPLLRRHVPGRRREGTWVLLYRIVQLLLTVMHLGRLL
jgi:hypothetical protein